MACSGGIPVDLLEMGSRPEQSHIDIFGGSQHIGRRVEGIPEVEQGVMVLQRLAVLYLVLRQ